MPRPRASGTERNIERYPGIKPHRGRGRLQHRGRQRIGPVRQALRRMGDQGSDMSHGVQVRGAKAVQETGAVLIAGPTASGKSALALAVAERIGGMVINTDSMQVYRDLKIITARPGAARDGARPASLYGHVDAAENYSAGRFLEDAAAALQAARRCRAGFRSSSAAPAFISRR